MRHVGDITKLSGYDLTPVDVICGGSPCQDLSVANGERKGLAGERSGLFFEMIRVVREMRENDLRNGRAAHLCRPRFLVWENVSGVLSSPPGRKGEDFQTILSEIIKIAEPEAPYVPMPDKGKWPYAGLLYDDMGRWSVGWRLHDGQYWGKTLYADGRIIMPGTPQRRRRLAIVADFAGLSAGVLFERKGMRWHPQTGGNEEQETPGGSGKSFEGAISFLERGGKPGGGKGILIQNELAGSINTQSTQNVFCIQGSGQTSQTSHGDGINEETSFTLNGVDIHGVAYEEIMCLNDQGGE